MDQGLPFTNVSAASQALLAQLQGIAQAGVPGAAAAAAGALSHAQKEQLLKFLQTVTGSERWLLQNLPVCMDLSNRLRK